jgi:hypothetical protein
MGFMPMTLTAVHGVTEEWVGVASAMINTAQQLGAALGVSVLATISTSARLPEAARVLQESLAGSDTNVLARAAEALTHGYTTAFLAGAGMLLVAAVIVIAAVNTRRTQGAAGAGAVA